jgi:hypothetical protein
MQSGDIISNGWAGQEPVETDDVHEDYGDVHRGSLLEREVVKHYKKTIDARLFWLTTHRTC